MIIGFDAKRAVQNSTGLGNYSRYVIDVLLRSCPENCYKLYAPKKKRNAKLFDILQGRENVAMCYPLSYVMRKVSSLWRLWFVCDDLKRDGVQVYHGLSNELPFGIGKCKGLRSVVTVHDLIFRELPHCYNFIDRLIYDFKFRRACEIADVIVAVSECTKRDIVKEYKISPDKIKVIYQGCDDIFRERCSGSQLEVVRDKYSLPHRFILSVGSIEERKNALAIVKAMAELPEELSLVLVGRRTAYSKRLERYAADAGLSGRVHVLHNVEHADLPAVYQMSETFVYPSLYEGFGIPVLEALVSGVPVVAATGSCLEEAGGAGSLYVSPYDVHALAEAIKSTFDKATRESMVSAGLEHARKFESDRVGQALCELYESLLA